MFGLDRRGFGMGVVGWQPWEDELVRRTQERHEAGEKHVFKMCARALARDVKAVYYRAAYLRTRGVLPPLPPRPEPQPKPEPAPEPIRLITMPVRLDPVMPPSEILKPKVPYRSDIPALSKALLMGGRAPRRQRCAA